MRRFILVFLLVLVGCGGSGGGGHTPSSPVGAGVPVLIKSAKITNFYLHVDSVGEHSAIRFQATIENDGEVALNNLIVRFHGNSCFPNANTEWSDLTMKEYIVSLGINDTITPPREGYLTAWTYNKCYMGSPWRPDQIYPVEIEIIHDGIVLDKWIKYFDEYDQGLTIGTEDYV
jgi:hypothetical protein